MSKIDLEFCYMCGSKDIKVLKHYLKCNNCGNAMPKGGQKDE